MNSNGIINKLKSIFYGPGWSQNDPLVRMGDPAGIPKIMPQDVKSFYNPNFPTQLAAYTCLQKLTGLLIFDHFLNTQSEPMFHPAIDKYGFITGLVALVWIFWTYWSIGELCNVNLMKNEIIRVGVTAFFFTNPVLNGELIRIPSIISIAFIISFLWSIYLYLRPYPKKVE